MSRLIRWRWAVAALVLGALIWQSMRLSSTEWRLPDRLSAWPLALATALATFSYVAMATAWARLRGRGEGWIDVGGPWFASLIARYAPGGIWQGAVRVSHHSMRGRGITDALIRFLSEQALACFSTSVVALLLSIALPSPLWLIASLAAVAATALVSSIVLARRGLPTGWAPAAIGWTLAAHVAMAAAVAFLVVSWRPLDITVFLLIARAFLVAGLAGLLVPLVPAGLGVREMVLTWLLTPTFSVGQALAIALASRAGLLCCELFVGGVWATAYRLRGRKAIEPGDVASKYEKLRNK
ncbi:MAG: hypothetical protein ABJC33_09205 [Betaproteobacteria bacterium]